MRRACSAIQLTWWRHGAYCECKLVLKDFCETVLICQVGGWTWTHIRPTWGRPGCWWTSRYASTHQGTMDSYSHECISQLKHKLPTDDFRAFDAGSCIILFEACSLWEEHLSSSCLWHNFSLTSLTCFVFGLGSSVAWLVLFSICLFVCLFVWLFVCLFVYAVGRSARDFFARRLHSSSKKCLFVCLFPSQNPSWNL